MTEEKKSRKTKLLPEWTVKINKYGDLHLTKNMIASISHFAEIDPSGPMEITFDKGRIVLTSPKSL